MLPIDLVDIPDECFDEVNIGVTEMELKYKENEAQCLSECVSILVHWGTNGKDLIEAIHAKTHMICL